MTFLDQRKILSTLWFIIAVFALHGQDHQTDAIHFEVNKIFPSLSISIADLEVITSLEELNPYYKPEWIKEMVSVKVSSLVQGIRKEALGYSEEFTQEQKQCIIQADRGSVISVKVTYIPDNSLPDNEVHEYPFTFVVEPAQDAFYAEGLDAMMAYLKESAIKKLESVSMEANDLYSIKFSIDTEGRVTDAQVFWPSENKEVDSILLSAVCNMPNWRPARYDDGSPAEQEFAFTVGNHQSCVMNLMHTQRLKDMLAENH